MFECCGEVVDAEVDDDEEMMVYACSSMFKHQQTPPASEKQVT